VLVGACVLVYVCMDVYERDVCVCVCVCVFNQNYNETYGTACRLRSCWLGCNFANQFQLLAVSISVTPFISP
jgi:hypothetical protein